MMRSALFTAIVLSLLLISPAWAQSADSNGDDNSGHHRCGGNSGEGVGNECPPQPPAPPPAPTPAPTPSPAPAPPPAPAPVTQPTTTPPVQTTPAPITHRWHPTDRSARPVRSLHPTQTVRPVAAPVTNEPTTIMDCGETIYAVPNSHVARMKPLCDERNDFVKNRRRADIISYHCPNQQKTDGGCYQTYVKTFFLDGSPKTAHYRSEAERICHLPFGTERKPDVQKLLLEGEEEVHQNQTQPFHDGNEFMEAVIGSTVAGCTAYGKPINNGRNCSLILIPNAPETTVELPGSTCSFLHPLQANSNTNAALAPQAQGIRKQNPFIVFHVTCGNHYMVLPELGRCESSLESLALNQPLSDAAVACIVANTGPNRGPVSSACYVTRWDECGHDGPQPCITINGTPPAPPEHIVTRITRSTTAKPATAADQSPPFLIFDVLCPRSASEVPEPNIRACSETVKALAINQPLSDAAAACLNAHSSWKDYSGECRVTRWSQCGPGQQPCTTLMGSSPPAPTSPNPAK